MERKEIVKILSQHFASSTIRSYLSGHRKPTYERMIMLYKEHNLPFDIWLDIKAFITPSKEARERKEKRFSESNAVKK